MNTPITIKPSARYTTCFCSCHASSPLAIRALSENGIAIPTMKRNAGNTMSGKLIASASAGMCLSQRVMPLTPPSSLTKIIATKVMPRNASIERTRPERSALIDFTAFDSGSQRRPHTEEELASVRIESARLVLVVAVVPEHRVVQVERVELQREAVAELVAGRHREVADAGFVLCGRAIEADEVVRAVGVGEAHAEDVVLVVALDVVGVLGRADEPRTVRVLAVGIGVVGRRAEACAERLLVAELKALVLRLHVDRRGDRELLDRAAVIRVGKHLLRRAEADVRRHVHVERSEERRVGKERRTGEG